MVKKSLLTFGMGAVVGLYRTFVLLQLWNWFVTTTFNLPELSFWTMYGIQLVIGFFNEHNDYPNEKRFKRLGLVLNACVPETMRASLHEELESEDALAWADAGYEIFVKFVAYTTTLLIGGVVHIFLR